MPRQARRRKRLQIEPLHGLLPRGRTSFVGRSNEMQDVCEMVRDGAGLVTLTGMGGVGKTRLAVEVAREAQSNYADGARFVSLEELTPDDDVAQRILAGLGIGDRARVPSLERLVDCLRPASMLLVVDNCEHALESTAAVVDQLLAHCRGVDVLATSREPLAISGEHVFRVPPFEQSSAVALFAARAAAVDASFKLDSSNAARVADICRAFEGIPLAIELAAAHTRSMSLSEIETALARPGDFLVRGPRLAPARQQTLLATIDWGYELLTADEQALLRRLVVFVGGFTVAAAQLVCSQPPVARERVGVMLDGLTAKSLLTADRSATTTRFSFSEVLRVYLLDRLSEAGETAMVRHAHLGWCLSLTPSNAADVVQQQDLEQLELEESNILAALRWTLDMDQIAEATLLATGFTSVWLAQGRFTQARTQLSAVAALPSAAANPGLSSLAYSWSALFAQNEGNLPVMEQLARQAFDLARTSGDEVAIAWASVQLGRAALDRGDLVGAAELCEAGLASAQKAGPLGVAVARRYCIILIELGEWDRAERLLDQAMQWARTLSYSFMDGRLRMLRAQLTAHKGKTAISELDASVGEAVTMERRLGSPAGLIEVLTSAAALFYEYHLPFRSASVLSEAISLAATYQSQLRLATAVELASCLLVGSSPVLATRVAASADAARRKLGSVRMPTEAARLRHFQQAARAVLGEQRWQDVSNVGSKLPIESVVEQIRPRLHAVQPTAALPESSRWTDPLTEREREVAILMGHGLTNRQISDALVVTRKTVEAHINHIFSKLSFSSRVEVARWAYECGLIAHNTHAIAET